MGARLLELFLDYKFVGNGNYRQEELPVSIGLWGLVTSVQAKSWIAIFSTKPTGAPGALPMRKEQPFADRLVAPPRATKTGSGERLTARVSRPGEHLNCESQSPQPN